MSDKPKVLIIAGGINIGKSLYNAQMLELIKERARQIQMQIIDEANIRDKPAMCWFDEAAEIDVKAWKKLGGKMFTVDSVCNLPVESPSVGKPKKTAQWLNKPYGRRK